MHEILNQVFHIAAKFVVVLLTVYHPTDLCLSERYSGSTRGQVGLKTARLTTSNRGQTHISSGADSLLQVDTASRPAERRARLAGEKRAVNAPEVHHRQAVALRPPAQPVPMAGHCLTAVADRLASIGSLPAVSWIGGLLITHV